MTEYEMAYLHAELTNSLIYQFSAFFTVLTAFLVASYLVAHKLTRTMTVIVVGMFLVLNAGVIMQNYRILQSLGGLTLQMHHMAQTGSGLMWHATANSPDWIPATMRGVGVTLYSMATIAAVYFFFHCRRVNGRVDVSTPHVSA
jgi:hypothetical protein